MGLRNLNNDKEWDYHKSKISELYYNYLSYCSKYDYLDRNSNPAVQVLECFDNKEKIKEKSNGSVNISNIEEALNYAYQRNNTYNVSNKSDIKFVTGLMEEKIPMLLDSTVKKSKRTYLHEKALVCYLIKHYKMNVDNKILSHEDLLFESLHSNKVPLNVDDLSDTLQDSLKERLIMEGLITEEEN